MSPPSNRDRSRSASSGISAAVRSLERMICFPASVSALKTKKNSSCVRSLPARNCTSSTISASAARYRLRHRSTVPCWIAAMSSSTSTWACTQATRSLPPDASAIAFPTECTRCVLPTPLVPVMKSGL